MKFDGCSSTAWAPYTGLSSLFVISLKFYTTPSSSNRIWHYNLITRLPFDPHFHHIDKGLVDTLSFFGWSFEIKHIVILFAPCLSFSGWDLPLGLLIDFVSDEDKWERFWIIRTGVLDEALLPFVKSIETCSISKVEAESATIGTSIERKSKWLEFFLTGSIPDLECNDLAVYLYLLFREISSNSWLRICTGLVMDVLLEQSGLTDTWVSQDDDFEEITLLWHIYFW